MQFLEGPICPSTDAHIKKIQSMHPTEYHSDIKKDKFESWVEKWVHFRTTVIKEMNQPQKYHMLSLI